MSPRRLLGFLIATLAWFSSPATAADCPPAVAMPSATQLQAAARQDRGLLWRIERDGRASYLYGTLHVGKPEWMAPGPAVRDALAASDTIALEIDPDDPALAAGLGAAADAPPLPRALRERLADAARQACLPAGALDALHPAMQAVLLAVLEARWVGLDPGYAQEQMFARIARADARSLVALETVALQKQALVPEAPEALQAMIESALEQLRDGSGRAVVARLARAWAEGDLATLESYEQWCDCARSDDERAGLRALNDERNPALAARIDELHRDGRRVFAAVGALHMTGARALPRLLAARGFRVERVTAPR